MKTNINMAYALQFEELVFANKNKNYGAFVLRRSYNRNLVIACAGAVLIILGVVLTQHYTAKAGGVKVITIKPGAIDLGAPPMDKPEEIIIEKTQVVPMQATIKFTPPVVVEDTKAPDGAMPTIEELIEATPWTSTNEGTEGGIDITTLEREVVRDIPVETETEPPVMYAEEMPAYAEGTEALMKFIAANIKYPELARKAGIEGRVYIYFIVNRDGTIANPEIAKSIGGGCDEEAIRVIKLLGKFIPGKQNGKAVKVKMSIPILFKLN